LLLLLSLEQRVEALLGGVEDDAAPRCHSSSRGFLGSQIPNCKLLTPGQLFGTFFSLAVMTQFVLVTNGYGSSSGIPGWKDVTIEEMYKFFAVLMVFGISCSPSRRMAWENKMFRNLVVCALMSRNLFEQIMRAWHYIDTSGMSLAEKAGRNTQDPFWQVTPLFESVQEVVPLLPRP
jgi:hypothetical protein